MHVSDYWSLMKTIALIAHDGKKADIVAFAMQNIPFLKRYHLVATKSTGALMRDKCKLDITQMASGPYGGDAEIAALIVQQKIHAVIFITDPLDKHPHDPDIQMLMRVCNVHNIPLATNIATAELIVHSLE